MNPPESIFAKQDCDVCNVKFEPGQRKVSFSHTDTWLTCCRECSVMCGTICDIMKNKELAIKCVKALKENIKIE